MKENDISRKRLKRKVLDRWENEGGRLCDDLTKAPGNSTRRKPARKAPKLSPGTIGSGRRQPSGE